MALALADVGLTLIHVAIVGAVSFGWIPRTTRRLHLWLMGLTALSWFGLGALYGTLGYCFLTDWHWQVKRARGEVDLPGSFIHYALTRWCALAPRPSATDALTGTVFGLAACASAVTHFRARRRHTEHDSG